MRKIENAQKEFCEYLITCPHCREILKDLNILSNVEGF